MAFIAHACTQCGHTPLWKVGAFCNCRCRCTAGPPVLRPTFGLDAKPVAAITVPGEKTGFASATCSCDACKELYAEQAGAVAAGPTNSDLRAFAAEHHIDCPKTGRVPARIRESYLAAHS